ncbi:MAG: hypothetical protein ACI865_003030 [Flavobacteriaceae bacterium]|jgi:hypothetical protein
MTRVLLDYLFYVDLVLPKKSAMKYLLFISVIILGSCKSEIRDDSVNADTKPHPQSEVEETQKESVTLYQSDDFNVSEYLKCISTKEEPNQWYYYTEKNKKEIALGVMSHRGMEMLFFKNSPDIVYDILGSECGFRLEENDEKSQWYEQISPACELR